MRRSRAIEICTVADAVRSALYREGEKVCPDAIAFRALPARNIDIEIYIEPDLCYRGNRVDGLSGVDWVIFDERIYEAARRGCGSSRIAMLHELGHPILGHRGINPRGLPYSNSSYTSRTTAERENEAYLFASFVLVPPSFVTTETRAAHIDIRFGITRDAANHTLQKYRAIWPSKWR